MFFYIKCVLFVLVLSISGEISAQEKRDSVRIYFHQGKVNIDTCFLDNGLSLIHILQPWLSSFHIWTY